MFFLHCIQKKQAASAILTAFKYSPSLIREKKKEHQKHRDPKNNQIQMMQRNDIIKKEVKLFSEHLVCNTPGKSLFCKRFIE